MTYSIIRQSVSFDDVLLQPQFSDIFSRKDINLSSSLQENMHLSLPIISAPMDTVTETDMAISMAGLGGLGIIHRYCTINEQCKMIFEAAQKGERLCGAAIGITGDFVERSIEAVASGASVLCVDVAHGHHILVRRALRVLRNTFGYGIHLMAGNISTLEAFNDLSDWGADSIRIGIGGGSICSTRIQTGHGMPTLQSVMDCAQSDRDAALIADGGIRTSGDIVKALAAGADFVMVWQVKKRNEAGATGSRRSKVCHIRCH